MTCKSFFVTDLAVNSLAWFIPQGRELDIAQWLLFGMREYTMMVDTISGSVSIPDRRWWMRSHVCQNPTNSLPSAHGVFWALHPQDVRVWVGCFRGNIFHCFLSTSPGFPLICSYFEHRWRVSLLFSIFLSFLSHSFSSKDEVRQQAKTHFQDSDPCFPEANIPIRQTLCPLYQVPKRAPGDTIMEMAMRLLHTDFLRHLLSWGGGAKCTSSWKLLHFNTI